MSKIPKGFLVPGDSWWPVETSYGEMLLGGCDESLHHVLLPNASREARPRLRAEDHGCPAAVRRAAAQLEEYFAGERTSFDLPLELLGTPFEKEVWLALQTIPYGETASYGEIARKLGRPSASRAVGMANSRNPLPVVLPCHRVIGSNGSLTGFGGGLELKALMLEHESEVAAGLSR
jgi:methylated-DNA-[protein]-cysteine S-methyltransferase